MVKVKRALISVSDKTGVIDFARELKNMGVEILPPEARQNYCAKIM